MNTRAGKTLDQKLAKIFLVSAVTSIVLSLVIFLAWGTSSPPTLTQEIAFPEKFSAALDRAEMVQLADVTYTAKDESGTLFVEDVSLFKQLFVAPHCTYAALQTVCSVVLVGSIAGAEDQVVHVSHVMIEQTAVSVAVLGDLYQYKSGHFEGNVFHVTAEKTRSLEPSAAFVFFWLAFVIFMVLVGIQLYRLKETPPGVRS